MGGLEQRWYYVKDGEKSEPVDIETIQSLIIRGHINTRTLVWTEGMASWSPISKTALNSLAGTELRTPPPPFRNNRSDENALALASEPSDRSLHSENSNRQNAQILEMQALPSVKQGESFPIEALRDRGERFWLSFIVAVNIIVFGIPLLFIFISPAVVLPVILMFSIYGGIIALVMWVSWKLTYAAIYGNSIEVTKDQYPQIHNIILQACNYLQIDKPTVLIYQGHGFFELLVAKRFTRRGLIIITSNMLDEFAARPNSRELMMFVGRQLGHIKAGHFRFWFFKDVIGRLAIFFHSAWQRRCHYTADRVGLLAAGSLEAAEQALLIITAGAKIAPGTNYMEIEEQRRKHFDSLWSYIALIFSSYPYMVDRIVRLRRFAIDIGIKAPTAGSFPIEHVPLKAMPILLIHGHDHLALLELKDLLHTKFPNVALKVMLTDQLGTMSMPEKFDKVAMNIHGAIALVTPDDVGAAVSQRELASPRARQNVIMEIGFVWGRLGRGRCMLMARGEVELPSDLSGIDLQRFEKSPRECVFELHTFLENISRES